MLLKEKKFATSPGVYCMVPTPTSNKQMKESKYSDKNQNKFRSNMNIHLFLLANTIIYRMLNYSRNLSLKQQACKL